MRDGPKPLSFLLNYAGLQSLKVPDGAQHCGAVPADVLHDFVAGVKRYQTDLRPVFCSPRRGVCSIGPVRIDAPDALHNGHDPVVLLVPSLVNTSTVFDLAQGHSFFAFLQHAGVYPLILDWGDLARDEECQSLDDLVVKYLVPCLEDVANLYQGPVHVLGYCLGGILSVAACSIASDCVASLTCLATPWDFSAGLGALAQRSVFYRDRVHEYMASPEILKAEWVQSVFTSLNSDAIVKKFAAFSKVEHGSMRENLFVAAEDWINEGVDMRFDLACDLVERLFVSNEACRGALRVAGVLIDASRIQQRAMVIASQRDVIVDFESAQALAGSLPNACMLAPDCGHVGMMASTQARVKVWENFVSWMKECA